ncbi:hypothetical protein QFZ23_002277 [Arthrobacter globiformis]|nr:hypothetical protein [Arthrobacter globiformis]
MSRLGGLLASWCPVKDSQYGSAAMHEPPTNGGVGYPGRPGGPGSDGFRAQDWLKNDWKPLSGANDVLSCTVGLSLAVRLSTKSCPIRGVPYLLPCGPGRASPPHLPIAEYAQP